MRLRVLATAIAPLLTALPLLAGCDKSPEPPSSKPIATASVPAAATHAPSAAAVAAVQPDLKDDDIAVPEDFLDEATKQIDQKNYRTEVDALQKEIDSPDN